MMNRLMVVVASVVPVLTAIACDGRECDRVKRVPCDNAASACQNGTCAGDDTGACFETNCIPTLCQCLDSVGCAWESTFCDGMTFD